MNWIPETIYKECNPGSAWANPMPPRISLDVIENVKRNYAHPFTTEFAAELLKEKQWEIIDTQPISIPLDHREAVGTGSETCPMCKGRRRYDLEHRGRTTGIVVTKSLRCPCTIYRDFYQVWNDPIIVPKRFRSARLATLEPSGLSKMSPERQIALIKLLSRNPDDNYFLWGDSKTGKSHTATALFRRALESWSVDRFGKSIKMRSVWKVNTTRLLESHVNWERRSNSEQPSTEYPLVTMEGIQEAIRNGYRPRLFVEEIDKVAMTDFKLKRFFALIDEVHAAEGQLVATSNSSPEELAGEWGCKEAEAALSRFGEGSRSHTVKFTADKG